MKLTANRVVLILHSVIIVLTIAGFYVAAVTHSLPASWQKVAGLVAGVIAALIAGTSMALKFLDGSQKFDQLQKRGAPPQEAVAAQPQVDVDALVEEKAQSAVRAAFASLGQPAPAPTAVAPVAPPATPPA